MDQGTRNMTGSGSGLRGGFYILHGQLKIWVGCMLALVGIIPLSGCPAELDSLESVLQRRRAALARLPEEDEGWMKRLAPASPDKWEERLADPNLLLVEEVREIALRHNPDIHAARARIAQALARILEARSSYFPTITLGHSSSRTMQTPQSRTLPFTVPAQPALNQAPVTLQTLDLTTILQLLTSPLFGQNDFGSTSSSFSQHATNLSVAWTLFDGLAREATVLSTKYTHSAAKMSLAEAQRLLVRATDEAYYQAQLGREQIIIAQADVDFSQNQLDAAKKRHAAGKATQGDVLNFQVRVWGARADEQAAIGLHENARTSLAELMGIQDAKLPATIALSALRKETDAELERQDADAWVSRAIAARPDLAQQEFELKAKGEQVKVAKAQYRPSLFFSGTYGFDRLSNMAYSRHDQASAMALEMRWQIFTGGFRKSRVRFAEAERVEVATHLTRRRLAVASEVRQSVTSLTNAQEQVRLQRLNLVAATENRRIVAAEYDAGKASLVRLNQAQLDLIETQGALAASRIRLRQAWTDLRAAAAVHRNEG